MRVLATLSGLVLLAARFFFSPTGRVTLFYLVHGRPFVA